jgi:hypothetical protein
MPNTLTNLILDLVVTGMNGLAYGEGENVQQPDAIRIDRMGGRQ